MIKRAFVIMPFSSTTSTTESQWSEVFSDVFKPALESCGYQCERAQPSTGNLAGSIVEQLRTSHIVLADLTDKNPNVFYELGVRHALRRGTIVVSQDAAHVPSDLRGYWFLLYGLRPGEVRAFKSEIARVVLEIESRPERSDNPVADYLDKDDAVVSTFVQRENLKKLSALMTELSGNISAALYGNSPRLPISVACLELLLHTRYIDPGPELLKMAYELWKILAFVREAYLDPEDAKILVPQLESLLSGINGVRESISRGDFAEPAAPSLMSWHNDNFGSMSCKGKVSLEEIIKGVRSTP